MAEDVAKKGAEVVHKDVAEGVAESVAEDTSGCGCGSGCARNVADKAACTLFWCDAHGEDSNKDVQLDRNLWDHLAPANIPSEPLIITAVGVPSPQPT